MTEERKEFARFRRQLMKEHCFPGLICMRCGHFSKSGGHLHHVIPIIKGGKTGLDNLVPLCHSCHDDVHRFNHDVLSLKDFVCIPDQYSMGVGVLTGAFDSDLSTRETFDLIMRCGRNIEMLKYEEKRPDDWPEYSVLWEEELAVFPKMAEVFK